MTAASVPRRELPIRWIGLAAAVLLLVVFVSQLSFFFAWSSHFPLSYAFNYGWTLVVLLLLTTWTRTVPLRLLAAAWFVGVYPITGAMLLVGLPLATVFGLENAVIPGFLLPLTEELIKLLPILLLFWWTARRGLWQLSATDGMLIGFMVGAGVAFHEDMMFGRVFGSGPTGWPPLSYAFPTIYSFRGVVGAYHEIWLALIGLAIGAAFLLRHRTRLAWLLPVAAWVIVFTDHWTNNYTIDPNAGEPFLALATALRGLVMDGALIPILLAAGIVGAVIGELVIVRSLARGDRLFADIPRGAWSEAISAAREGGWRQVQALREYARRRRSAYYAVWAQAPLGVGAETSTHLVRGLAARAAAADLPPPPTRSPGQDTAARASAGASAAPGSKP